MDCAKIESGLQLFTRLSQHATVEKINTKIFPVGPFPNDTIEITGAPMTGKTLLITDFIARCILPVQYSGRNSGAVIINTDHHFDILKLITVMEIVVNQSGRLVKNAESIIKNSLRNLILFDCYDSQQMQLTFLNLNKILLEDLNIGLVVLDSLSAYYWDYRMRNGIISFQQYHSKILDSLKDSIKNSNVVTIFTRFENYSIPEKEAHTSNETYKITLNKLDGKFAAVITNNDKNITRTVVYSIGATIYF